MPGGRPPSCFIVIISVWDAMRVGYGAEESGEEERSRLEWEGREVLWCCKQLYMLFLCTLSVGGLDCAWCLGGNLLEENIFIF